MSAVSCMIMAGGSGERLWPLVRGRMPKVCLPIGGTTLLGATIRRVRALDAAPWIITTAVQRRAVQRAVPAGARVSVIAEPQPRNTAACIALAASALARRDPDAILVALPADHWIQPAAAFHRTVRAAIDVAARSDRLVMLGLRPTRVHPGLGHIRAIPRGERVRGCRVFDVARFVEKPDPRAARRLLRRPDAFWNIGIFVGRATTFLAKLHQCLPRRTEQFSALSRELGTPAFARHSVAVYRRLQPVSFDEGVLVHVRDSLMVDAAFAWEDLGSWESWVRLTRRSCQALAMDGRNVHVVGSDHHLVATIGLDDIIVVQTPDATLVCRSGDAQAVRRIVGRLARVPRLAKYL